jgi:carboxyl-terminal processing protease
MQRLGFYRKLLAAGLALALLMTGVAASASLITTAPGQPAQAQGNEPASAADLFKPFWETWDLLHQNYVDPLDDDSLLEGALTGLTRAVKDPNFDLPMPEPVTDPANTDERFVPFWDMWNLIHQKYNNLDDTALMEGALRGMMQSLGDPNTDYMDPQTFAMVNESMTGAYEGIGAVVRQNEQVGGLELVSIMVGSPAEKAGLQPGDTIVRVGGQDVTPLDQNEIIAMVRGPAGTLVQLGILRPGEADILKFDVTRARIDVASVTSKVLDGNIGYVRLSQFELNTGQDLRTALQKIDADHLTGLILDLRGNPGGYLTTAIEVGSAFISDGAIVVERGPNREINHPALGDAIAPDVPMVVLVDQGSASASELIAGALQDHKRATVVGMPTFGKGSVQTWNQLSNGGGIRITISRWYTPNGHSVSEVGIKPDVEVPYIPNDQSGDDDNQLTAAIQVLNGTYEPSPLARRYMELQLMAQ